MLIKIISLVFNNNNNNNNNNNKASTIRYYTYVPVWVGVHVFACVGGCGCVSGCVGGYIR